MYSHDMFTKERNTNNLLSLLLSFTRTPSCRQKRRRLPNTPSGRPSPGEGRVSSLAYRLSLLVARSYSSHRRTSLCFGEDQVNFSRAHHILCNFSTSGCWVSSPGRAFDVGLRRSGRLGPFFVRMRGKVSELSPPNR